MKVKSISELEVGMWLYASSAIYEVVGEYDWEGDKIALKEVIIEDEFGNYHLDDEVDYWKLKEVLNLDIN